jgi:putative ABC transport system substrate-binding protein
MAFRYADGDNARLPAFAEELVRLAPRVIVTDSRLSSLEVKKASATIPIVSPFLTDPTGLGLAASDARRGGQVTGILFTLDSLPGKQLEIALEIIPGAKKIGVLSNATNPTQAIPRRNTEAGAAALAIKLVSAEVRGAGDLDAAFQALAGERVDFVSVFPDSLLFIERRRIATLAIGAKLPTLFAFREHVEAGGLLSYRVDARESNRRAATYVDRRFAHRATHQAGAGDQLRDRKCSRSHDASFAARTRRRGDRMRRRVSESTIEQTLIRRPG